MTLSTLILQHLGSVNDVKLGRLVTNVEQPQHGFFEPVHCSKYAEPGDYTRTEGQNYDAIQKAYHGFAVETAVANVLRLFGKMNASNTDSFKAQTFSTVRLQDAEGKFDAICENKDAQDWFTKQKKKGCDVYYVVGYQTVAKAEFETDRRRAAEGEAGAAGKDPHTGTEAKFKAKGDKGSQAAVSWKSEQEALWAIQYLKVELKLFSAPNLQQASLERRNRPHWKLMWKRSAADNQEELNLEASLSGSGLGTGYTSANVSGEEMVFFKADATDSKTEKQN